ncbi:MAG TPA: ORF6N domain-containing protein [Candidatus Angelobacter sp.]|nr:ORF6N domain-containing protein [Candidatus Angelobacter sp.]
MPKTPKTVMQAKPLEHHIHIVRGQKVMLDRDLAAVYEVPTKALNQAVRRNLERFPSDFMFQLSNEEASALRSQIVTLEKGRGRYPKYAPLAFTELGVAMLSSVLQSNRAVQMNILIMRTFVRLREMIATNKDFAARIEKLERSHDQAASVIEVIVEDIDKLASEVKQMKTLPTPPKRKIGFDL